MDCFLGIDSGRAPGIGFPPPGKTHTDLISGLSIAEDHHLRGFLLCAVHLQGSTSPGLPTTVPPPRAALSKRVNTEANSQATSVPVGPVPLLGAGNDHVALNSYGDSWQVARLQD